MAAQVVLRFLADTKSLDKGFARVSKQIGEQSSNFSKFGALVGGLGLGVAVTKFGTDSAKAFIQAEAAQAKLSNAFQKFPGLADTNVKAIQKLNLALQRKTKFDDDAVASGQAVLAGFGLTGKQLTEITPLLLDYASRTGKDLPTAAQDLGKAILGQGRALKAIGVNFKDTGSAAGNFDQLMGSLRTKVGGFAEKEGKTAGGQLAILKNQFGELEEKVGKVLVPALLKLSSVVLGIVTWFQNLNPNVQLAIEILGGAVVAVVALTKAIQLWEAAQAALNVVLAANPIGLIVIGIAALVAAFVIAYKKSETFRDIVNGAFNAVATVVRTVIRGWVLEFEIIKGAIEAVVGFVAALPGRISRAATGMWDGIKDAFRAAINWIIRAWNSLDFKLPSVDTHIPGIGKIGGFTLGTPDIPLLASGGIITQPTLAMLGERGREAVIPLGRGGIGGNTYNITVNGGSDGREMGAQIVDAIKRYERRNGTGWRN